MIIEEYRSRYGGRDAAPGWEAIDSRLSEIYGNAEPLWHIPAVPHFSIGGSDPLDGVSIFARGDDPIPHLHCVSYGMSNLYYDEEAISQEFSRFGFEFSFRLAAPDAGMLKRSDSAPAWAWHLLQNLARYVFRSGRWFEPYHFVDLKAPIDPNRDTAITAMAFSIDPELGEIVTPHGRVQFLQGFGITMAEHEEIRSTDSSARPLLERIRAHNPLLITDLNRATN